MSDTREKDRLVALAMACEDYAKTLDYGHTEAGAAYRDVADSLRSILAGEVPLLLKPAYARGIRARGER